MLLIAWLFIGLAVGTVNGLTLLTTTTRVSPRAIAALAAGALVRVGLSAVLLVGALRQGIVPGLLAFAGLTAARWGVVLWVHSKGSNA